MSERAIKIIMALITIAIILTVLAVCIGIPLQQSTQENTGYNAAYSKKEVDERDVSARFVTLQHIDDSHGNGFVSTPSNNFEIQESDDIQDGEKNSEDMITMRSGGNRPVNLAMLRFGDPLSKTPMIDGKVTKSLIPKYDIQGKAVSPTQTPTDSTFIMPESDIQEGGRDSKERTASHDNVTPTGPSSRDEQSSPPNALITPAQRSDIHPELLHPVQTSKSTYTVSSPRDDVATEASKEPEQHVPSTQTEIKTETNSSVAEPGDLIESNQLTSNEINMPENLAEDVKSNLASIANSLDSMVQLLKDMQHKTDKMFENMTATMNGLFQNLPNLLAATPVPSPRDCTDIAAQGFNESTTYVINPEGAQSYRVYCDLHSEGGGWTVFQRRFDGSVNFYQSWQEYVDGFGKAFGEYWAGLELVHRLTLTGTWELLIQLEDFDGNLAFAHYASFRVGSAESNYRLYVGAYDGTAGDAMTEDNHNKEFSTFNRDNDERSWGNCAQYRKGAWWYGSCSAANLNGLYLGPKKVSDTGMYWRKWKNSYEVLRRSEMKMRRIL